MEEITVEDYHAKKTRLSTFSGSSADRFALTILPAVLKSLSDGTDISVPCWLDGGMTDGVTSTIPMAFPLTLRQVQTCINSIQLAQAH